MTPVSNYLPGRALRTLERLGNLMCPGVEGMPAFSATGCLHALDELLAATPEADRRDLRHLLLVLSVWPDRGLAWLLRVAGRAEDAWSPLRPLLRQLDLGLRGIVYSLYYSDLGYLNQSSGVHAAMDYHIHCEQEH
ncbi:hypothetical protein AAIA72_01415 [Hahella sp. SMD15-11]|uniref:Uncharacterized protein n=1 Tax=Thermohahella caldifontis TaxID=3142973 RepID=A0AB39UWV5_9GAMM